ncbi:hypothetical protein VCHE09_2373 [Vibrio paracholerae HE-09]|nr:hypothetical protein VCHE09_2373 [Vibrio paracholerae HE-09]
MGYSVFTASILKLSLFDQVRVLTSVFYQKTYFLLHNKLTLQKIYFHLLLKK